MTVTHSRTAAPFPNAWAASDATGGAAPQPVNVTSHRWEFQGHSIHCLKATPQDHGQLAASGRRPALVLIHGFGASTRHWRHNVPRLAQRYEVHAFDLLGFGRSAKPTDLALDTTFWRDQLLAYTRERVGRPAVFVGNSLGGYVALRAAAAQPDSSAGVALLNPMGRFRCEQEGGQGQGGLSWASNGWPWWPWGAPFSKHGFFRGCCSRACGDRAVSVASCGKCTWIQPTWTRTWWIPSEVPPSIRAPLPCFPTCSTCPPTSRWMGGFPGYVPRCCSAGDVMTPGSIPFPGWRCFVRPRRMPGEVMLDAGHCPHDEQPERFNTILLQWLDGLENKAMA